MPSRRDPILPLVLALLLLAPRAWTEPNETDTTTASYREVAPLAVRFETLTALRWHPAGRLLAADGPAQRIKVLTPAGRVEREIPLDFNPEALNVAPDGTLYCGGQGHLASLTFTGEILQRAEAPGDVSSAVDATSRRRARGRPTRISGIAVTNQDVFVAFGAGWSLGSKSKLFRFDRHWAAPRLLIEGLRGCCQRCDITARDGKLYLAENGAHRVVVYSREGQRLAAWGTRQRSGLEGFGSCCNPMNLCFDAEGRLYTAESGLGRIKRYTPDGRLLGLMGNVDVERFNRSSGLAASCSNIALAVTPDRKRIYVMDFKERLIRVLARGD